MSALRLRDTSSASTCPECGAPSPADARFCGACGARLAANAPVGAQALLPRTRERDPPAGTRRRPGSVALVALVALVVTTVLLAGDGSPTAVADEGRTLRGVGGTGITSSAGTTPARIAWRWTRSDEVRSGPAPSPFLGASVRLGDLLLLDADGVLHAADAMTGDVLWSGPVCCGELQLADETLAVHVGTQLVVLDPATGRIKRHIDLPGRASYGTVRVPVANGLAVLHDVGGDVHGVDLRTAEKRWTVQDAWSVQHVTDSVALVQDEAHLVAVDLATGAELWSERFDDWWDVVLIGGVAVRHRLGAVEALDVRNGTALWTAEQPDLGSAPLVMGDDRVGVWSLASAITRTPRLLVYDLATGRELERIDLPSLDGATVAPSSHGVVLHDAGELFLWRDGARRWTVRTHPLLGESRPVSEEPHAPPLVDGDLVLLAEGNEVVAFELATGVERWRLPITPRTRFWWDAAMVTAGEDLILLPPGPIDAGTALERRTGLKVGSTAWGRPLLGTDGGVLTVDEGGNVGLRTLEGEEVWRHTSGSYTFSAFPLGPAGVATVGEGSEGATSPYESTARIDVLDLGSGESLAALDVPWDVRVATQGSTLYLRDGTGGSVRRLDLDDDLEEVWRSDPATGGTWIAATQDHVVSADPAGASVLDARDGHEVRRLVYERLAPEAPALRETTLVVTNGASELHAWDVVTGERIWATSLEAPVSYGVTIGGGIAYVPDTEGGLNALRVSDGRVLGRIDLGELAAGPVLAADGYVYIPLAEGGVVALR